MSAKEKKKNYKYMNKIIKLKITNNNLFNHYSNMFKHFTFLSQCTCFIYKIKINNKFV